MPIFDKVSEALDVLKISQTEVFLSVKTGSGKASQIRSTALRKGFKVSLKMAPTGYRVRFVESIDSKEQQAAISSKTKINDAYQASKQQNWDPSNPLDQLLDGDSLEEKMLSLKMSGGGSFKTQCKIGQIKKVAGKCGVKYTQEDHGDYRVVTI